MYEMLTWRPPFKGKDHQDTLSQIIARDPVEPRKLNQRVPKDLETIVLKCLRKDPSDRYRTAEALAQDLRRFVRGDPIEARPQSALEKVSRRLWRYRWGTAACGCALVLLGTIGILAYENYWASVQQAQTKKLQDRAFYDKYVPQAALVLQRDSFLASQDLRGVDILEPTVRASTKYCFPGFFATFGRKPLIGMCVSLDEAIVRVPNRPEAYYFKAKALRILGQHKSVIKELDHALERDPSFVPARLLLEELLEQGNGGADRRSNMLGPRTYAVGSWQSDWLRAHAALKECRPDKAVRAFSALSERRLEHNGKIYIGADIEILLGRGRARLEARDFYGAIEDFAAARHLLPQALEPSLLLAKAYYVLGGDAKAKAKEIFESIHTKKLVEEGTAVLISTIYLSLGDHEEALNWAERIPGGQEVVRACAKSTILLAGGAAKEAEEQARKAISLNPDFPWAYGALGMALTVPGGSSQAEEAFKTSIALDATYVPGYVGLGRELCRQGYWEEGEAKLWRAIELDPDYIDAYHEYGRTLYWKRDFEKVDEILRLASKGRQRSAESESCRGFIFVERGSYDRALEILQGALALDSRCGAHYGLGFLYAVLNDVEEAIRHFRLAIEHRPYTGIYYRDLISVLAREERLACDEELGQLVCVLQRHLTSIRDYALKRQAREALVLAGLHLGTEADRSRALELSRERIEALEASQGTEAHPELVDALTLLGRALYHNGQVAEAVTVLGEACRLPREYRSSRATWFLEERLAEYRKRIRGLPTYDSVEAALISSHAVEIIPRDAAWRYVSGTAEPSGTGEWVTREFDDSSWPTGASGFGYWHGDEGTYLSDMHAEYTTVYIRKSFAIEDASLLQRLVLRVWTNGGCVAYLNGHEIARVRVSKDPKWLPFDAVPLWEANPLVPAEIAVAPGLLRTGKNVVAIQGLSLSKHERGFALIPALIGELPRDPARDEEVLRKFRTVAEEDDNARLLYLEGRVLQRAGSYRKAAAKFREVTLLEEAEPEPYLWLAEALRLGGEVQGAEEVLCGALRKGLNPTGQLWDHWIAISLTDVRHTPEEILTGMPTPEGGGTEYGDNLRWLMEQLKEGNTIRINCGGGDYIGGNSTKWSRDRFYRGGRSMKVRLSKEDAAGVEDLPLYATNRYSEQPPGGLIYRIPLPLGQYHVTLHFAELVHGILVGGERKFDVAVEGKTVFEEYELPFRKPDIHRLKTSVDDGFLDIEYKQGSTSFPMISGIEIVRTE